MILQPFDQLGRAVYTIEPGETEDPATARVFLTPGLPAEPSEEQTLHEVVVTPRADTTAEGASFLPLDALSPIAFSELVRDLDLL